MVLCSCMGVCLWFVSSRQQLSAPWVICSQLTVGQQSGTTWFALLQSSVYFCMRPVWNTDLPESVSENFNANFMMKQAKKINNLVNKLRTMWFLIDKGKKHKHQVLTEEKLDDIGTRLEHIPRKSLKHLAQETGVQVRQHKCWSHPVKVGVWCAVSARRIVVHVFLTKQLILKDIYM
jgi:hypothetical protein